MTEPLKFNIAELRKAVAKEFLLTLPAECLQGELGAEIRLEGPLSVQLSFTARNGRLVCRGEVKGAWQLECSRCLAPSRSAFTAPVEFSSPLSEGGFFDAKEELRQALLLAVPMRAYCRPDCLGLCLRCGGNKNVKECGCALPTAPVLAADHPIHARRKNA